MTGNNLQPAEHTASSAVAPTRKYTPWPMTAQHSVALDRLLLAIVRGEAPIFSEEIPQGEPCRCMAGHDWEIALTSDDVVEQFGLILMRLDEAFEALSQIGHVCAEATNSLSAPKLARLIRLLPFSPETFSALANSHRRPTGGSQ